MRSVVLAVMMASAGTVCAQGVETRAATLAEQRSFQQYIQRSAPGTTPPALQVQRARGGKGWQVSAYNDATPVRLVLPLCRVARTRYTQAADDSWSSSTEQHVWVHHTTACGMPPNNMVQLRAPLAELDVLRLIQANGELLQRARLLMAGNTSCAPMRSRNFLLQSIGKTKEGLFLLGFLNDIGGLADVSVRQSRAELVAWNVSCN